MAERTLLEQELVELLAHAIPGTYGYSAEAMRAAVLAEREACAKVCDWERSTPERGTVARYLGKRIRERSNAGDKL